MKQRLVKYSALSLFIALALNCTKSQMPDTAPIVPAPASDSIHYLALGDSYTIGQSVEATERFPYLTAALLRYRHLPVAEPRYIATTGWTTANLLTAINAATNLKTYDVVSLLIGVNDQYQQLDTAGYRTRFIQLLQKAISLAGNRKARVFVLSIPDYSATPFVAAAGKARIHDEINAFNAINKEITLADSITYIDITPLTREAATDGTLLAHDNLHYSAKEHQLWAELLAPAIQKALQ